MVLLAIFFNYLQVRCLFNHVFIYQCFYSSLVHIHAHHFVNLSKPRRKSDRMIILSSGMFAFSTNLSSYLSTSIAVKACVSVRLLYLSTLQMRLFIQFTRLSISLVNYSAVLSIQLIHPCIQFNPIYPTFLSTYPHLPVCLSFG